MNPRTFLQEFSNSAERDRIVEAVYDSFMVYAREQKIREGDLSTEEIEALAEAVVDRGLGFEAEIDRTEWRSGG